MQGLGLANLRKYIFLHKNLALYVMYIQKKSNYYYFPYYIYYNCFFMDWTINYAEMCPKWIMCTLLIIFFFYSSPFFSST